MRKLITLAALAMSLGANAQNIQLHYDFGRHIYSNDENDRQFVTATFEHFHADRLGSWYYFIDLDVDNKGMKAAYTEVSREFNFYKPGDKGAFAAHIEYDGGLSRGFSYQQAGLVGAAWNGHNADFSKTYSLQVLYKHMISDKGGHSAYPSFQITGVWGLNFCKDKLTFSGFFDLWSEKANNRYLVFLSEPQLWYNVHKHFSLGTEVELSYNFPYNNDKFYVNPTFALKYTF